jgi:AraC family L-rhamnose operon regulatory protein RhaS
MAIKAFYTVSQQDVLLSTQLPVRTQWFSLTHPVRPHDHAYHELCIVVKGSLRHRTASGETAVKAGGAIIVPPKAVHALVPSMKTRVINVYYLAEWLAMDLASLWPEPNLVPLFLSRTVLGPRAEVAIVDIKLTARELISVVSDLQDIESESQNAVASQVLIRGAIFKVLVRLSRASLRSTPHRQYFREEVWSAIAHIERLVQTSSPLILTDLAKEVRLSMDYFGKLFSTAMGRTMGEYFQLRRVHRACQLLMDQRYSITQVALELGYSDAPHFCRMFKRYRKMSPNQYRASYTLRRGTALSPV